MVLGFRIVSQYGVWNHWKRISIRSILMNILLNPQMWTDLAVGFVFWKPWFFNSGKSRVLDSVNDFKKLGWKSRRGKMWIFRSRKKIKWLQCWDMVWNNHYCIGSSSSLRDSDEVAHDHRDSQSSPIDVKSTNLSQKKKLSHILERSSEEIKT
jgi:hypothetical protein